MDENTNNSNEHPEVITPDNEKETPDTSSSPETHETESPEESAPAESEAAASNEPAGTTEDKPEEASSSDEAPAATSPQASEEPQESEAADAAKPETTDAEKSTVAAETPVPASTAATPSTPAPAVIGTPPPSTASDDTAAAPVDGSKPVVADQASKKKLTKTIAIVAIVVILAVAAIVVAMSMGTKKIHVTTTSTTATTVKPVQTNTWTGKADTYNWDTAANWSIGVPVNGQTLAFNASAIKQPSGNTVVTFQDNVPSLTVNKLIIDGTGVGFDIKGNPLTITSGISQDITAASKTAPAAAVDLENSITFAADQSVQAAANNNLTFNGLATPATTTIGANTVQFSATKSSDIEVFTPIVGTGAIEVPATTSTAGNVDFNTASPDFTGSVMVNAGATIGMGNQNTVGTGVSATDAFGTGAITIASGGYLELNEAGATSYTIPNTITVDGNGGASVSKNNGAYTGAVSTCITKAQEGCGDGATVTFTGKVTLTGNTEFGAFYGVDSPQVSPSTTATYVLKNLVANGHTVTAVPSSKAVIQKS
jgi:hypothetical protein